MGATTSQGVGHGSVEGHNRGSKFFNIGGSRILGPRVVAAGVSPALATGAVVILPLLSGVVGDYVVAGANKTAAAAWGITMTFTSNATVLTFAGTDTNVIHWAIFKTGKEI